MNGYTTWEKEISTALKEYGEDWPDVVGTTLTDEQANQKFYCGFGGHEGHPFTLWTENRVYFPWVYDGAEGVASVPRNPCNEATKHIGGE